MESNKFQVKKYQVTLGGDLPSIISGEDVKICGIIGCYGDDSQLMLNFVADGDTIPDAIYDEKKNLGSIYLPSSEIDTYIDLLRNEKPIYAYVNSEKPEWCNISTSHEPVGENE